MEVNIVEIRNFIDTYIRERVQADGGELSFQSFENNLLTVKVQAECSKCHLTDNCLKEWIMQNIYEKFNINIGMEIIKSKPYFWDK